MAVPAVATAHITNPVNFYDYPLNFGFPSGSSILVCQHLAQSVNTTGSYWNALVIGSDY
jgi:hypothetical protein